MFDHVNPKSILGVNKDYGPVKLSSVELSTCWLLGAADAKKVLVDLPGIVALDVNWVAISKEDYEGTAPDMLRPRGVYVGVTPTADETTAATGGAQAAADGGAPAHKESEEWEEWIDWDEA
eukprot:4998328-Prymnesium_polylepis.1